MNTTAAQQATELTFAIEHANELLAWLVGAPTDRGIKRGMHAESLRRVIEAASLLSQGGSQPPVAYATLQEKGRKIVWTLTSELWESVSECRLKPVPLYASPPNAGTDAARDDCDVCGTALDLLSDTTCDDCVDHQAHVAAAREPSGDTDEWFNDDDVEAAQRAYDQTAKAKYGYADPMAFAVQAALQSMKDRGAFTPIAAARDDGVGQDADPAEFCLYCDDECVAGSSGPRQEALREIMHYAMQYNQDGAVRIEEVIRKPLSAIEDDAALRDEKAKRDDGPRESDLDKARTASGVQRGVAK